jgi:hypothetical protein
MKIDSPERFLDYHLNRSFDNDILSYRLFLMDCLDHISNRKHVINEWMNQVKSPKPAFSINPEELTKHVFEKLRFIKNGAFGHNVKVAQVVGAYEALKPYLPKMDERKAAQFLQRVVFLPPPQQD